MDAANKQAFICAKARENANDPHSSKVLWSRHGIAELSNEGWDRSTVERALEECVLIEDYAHLHRPLPDCLILGFMASREPMHAVVALDAVNDRIFMVTVYRPFPEEWKNDWTTRKS
jgi:hypothetical protein